MNTIDTLQHVQNTQSQVSHGSVLRTAEIIKKRFISIDGFDHETFADAHKKVFRRGWKKRGLHAENDWIHTLDLTLVAPGWLEAKGLDVEMGVVLGYVHEAGEVGPRGAGDTLPGEKTKSAQVNDERIGVEGLARLCGEDLISEPWEQYNAGETPEAILLEELDKLVTVREAARRGIWEEFFEYYKEKGTFSDTDIFRAAEDMRHIKPTLV